MRKEWGLSNNKALLNFSQNYCSTESEILKSEAFRSVLTHYLIREQRRNSQSFEFISELFEEDDIDRLVKELTKLVKQLLIMDSKTLAEDIPMYVPVYERRKELRHFVEEVYTFWRNIERYAILHDSNDNDGYFNRHFMEAKDQFDKLVIKFYRTISSNISMTKPNVYRQVPAGTNVGMIVYDSMWPVPIGYEGLSTIPFIKEIILEAPFITYPKRNKRDGFFHELEIHPLKRCSLNADRYFCYPAKVGGNIAYIFVERDFLTHGISLANLFELCKPEEIVGRKPELLLIFGAEDLRDEAVSGYYQDTDNDMLVGYVSANNDHDYFGYMKKMLLTLNNIYNIRKGCLPIHGAMVKIELNSGEQANIVIVGDSGAGKSESIEAFRSLAEEHISGMSVIFDDMGTFVIEDGIIKAYGTEIGAFVRLDDLDSGYAFKELDRSIFMNPDKINARLITPISEYEDIMAGETVDLFLYANNYSPVEQGQAIEFIDDPEYAKKVFIEGKRMAKGTTTEKGLTTSFFANPFGPYQMQDETLEIIDKVFERLYANDCKVGVMYTQLGLEEQEKEGPKLAALNLFEVIKNLKGE